MRRREFIAGLGGAAAAWPLAARAQQGERVRRLGILWAAGVNDSVSNIWHNAFIQGLSELGWIEGRNLHIDMRWHPRDAGEARAFARELIDLHPDVLVTGTPLLVRVLQQETHIIPIVMNGAGDSVVSGLVKSLSRPRAIRPASPISGHRFPAGGCSCSGRRCRALPGSRLRRGC